MYIEKLHYINVGPIKKLDINFMQNGETIPKPIVIVGKNGSGKSILLSHIVDACYEIADAAFTNAMKKTEGIRNQYFKEIAPYQISIGQNVMFAHIKFKQDSTKFEYMYKCGNSSKEDYLKKYNNHISEVFNWGAQDNFKSVTASKNDALKTFGQEVVCYFGPDRYMQPCWMGSQYFHSWKVNESAFIEKTYSDKMKNPITVENEINSTIQWLISVIIDARADVENIDFANNDCKLFVPQTSRYSLIRSITIKKNVERIMSEILGVEIRFDLLDRSFKNARFNIINTKTNQAVVHSLDWLSTGQLALFHIFATIIKYADNLNSKESFALNQIKGLVIIDEAELHLHVQLQREVLPKLIELFPQIQFIISTHSPLLLLGMQEELGADGLNIFDIPSGLNINPEQFSEFENAYNYFKETTKFQEEIKNEINKRNERPLIITEGPSDWRHMKAALQSLCIDSRCSGWLSKLEFDFLEYDSKNNPNPDSVVLNMGDTVLVDMCEQFSKIEQSRKLIFIADRDNLSVTKKLIQNETCYKNWGNNVYSLLLPVPEFRKETPAICIEHYYRDDEIKKEVICPDNVRRRLYMGNDFYESGYGINNGMLCFKQKACGEGKINIIDGNDRDRVVDPKLRENSPNYALTKMQFAKRILNNETPFENIDFSAFIELFKIIRDILQN